MKEKLIVAAVMALAASGATCEGLSSLLLANTEITVSVIVPPGSFTEPGQEHPIADLPEFCRVAGAIKPTPDSDIRFEVWLPTSGWKEKFQGVGNGGFAGSINYGGLATALRRGYATASTDTGHTSVPGPPDASWALGHPEKLVDYGHRAIHEMTVKAKAITTAFYDKPPSRSYFSSCSNGGRQALMEAQRYPDDSDGIIAGAPANHFTHLLLGFVWNLQALSQSPGHAIQPDKLQVIERSVMRRCDLNDGVRDDVVGEPGRCSFDPSVLACSSAGPSQCLTRTQVDALKMIYGGPRSKGKVLFPGFVPGCEPGRGSWSAWITGHGSGDGLQAAFSTQFLKNMVFENPEYDYNRFDFDRDRDLMAVERLSPILDATNPDLTAFERRGGKLILYHGWCDAAIPAGSTIKYYNAVVAKMGKKNASSFVRLYLAPGMWHCGGGPGANSFGATGEGAAEMADALESWVEEGRTPGAIVAKKLKPGMSPNDPSAGAVDRSRPLCPYPQAASYTGKGSSDTASSFVCVAR